MTIAFDAPAATDLARDTELLSQVLHEVLVEQNGSAVAQEVRWLHETAAALRAGDASAGAALQELVQKLPHEEVEPFIRACALQLQLANIAEERERVRRAGLDGGGSDRHRGGIECATSAVQRPASRSAAASPATAASTPAVGIRP